MTEELKKILSLGKSNRKTGTQTTQIDKEQEIKKELDKYYNKDEVYFTREIKKARMGYM